MQLTDIQTEINQEMYSGVLSEQLRVVERAMQVLKDSPNPGYSDERTTIFFDHTGGTRISTVASTQLEGGIFVYHILNEESGELRTIFCREGLHDKARVLPKNAISIEGNDTVLFLLYDKLRSLSDSLSVEEITRRGVKIVKGSSDMA